MSHWERRSMSQVSNTSFTTTASSNAMAVVDYLSSMMSALPFIVCAALFRTVAVIMGEGMLGLWSADSEIYRLFYSWLYNAGYYFLPIYLGWAVARQLGCSEQLGMMLGGVLIAPDLLKLVDAASTTGASMTSVYGLLPRRSTITRRLLFRFSSRCPCYGEWSVSLSALSLRPWRFRLFRLQPCLSWFRFRCVSRAGGQLFGHAVGPAYVYAWQFRWHRVAAHAHGACRGLGVPKDRGRQQRCPIARLCAVYECGNDSGILIAATMATFAVWGMPFGASLRVADKDEKAPCWAIRISGVLGRRK